MSFQTELAISQVTGHSVTDLLVTTLFKAVCPDKYLAMYQFMFSQFMKTTVDS